MTCFKLLNIKMKFFKSFIIINTLLCLTIATPNANDTEMMEFNEFLRKIQVEKPDIVTRIVKIDEGNLSLKTFFEQTPSHGSIENGVWQVSDEGIYRTGTLLHSVMSCEYSESIYYLVQVLSGAITAFYKNHMEENRDNIQNFFYNPLKDVLSPMVLTLIGLLKYTKHYSQKNQEFLNTILSWYVIIMHSEYKETVKTSSVRIYHIDYTPTTVYQVEKYLKIFILSNCKDVDEFGTFKSKIDNELQNFQNIDNYKKSFEEELNKLPKFFFNKFLSQKYETLGLFVLTPTNNYSTGIRGFLGQQSSSLSVTVKWDNQITGELSFIHDEHILNNASGIYSILKYERIFLQSITKIIMGFISNELTLILSDPQLSESKLYIELQNKLISTLDKYIQKFQNEGQPTYLINNMSIIKSELWILHNNPYSFEDKKTEIGKYIAKLNASKIKVSPDAGLVKLKAFMEGLSRKLICAKLHPVVSNAYWEKVYFTPTRISDYVIDLKYIQKKFEVISETDRTCKNLSYISGRIIDIKSTIKECEKVVMSNESDKITTCFTNLSTKYIRIKIKIEELVSSVDDTLNFNWKRSLLLVIYNIKNIESYGTHDKEIERVVKDLNILYDCFSDYFDIGFQLTCKSLPVWRPENDSQPIALDTSFSQAEYKSMQKKLADVIAYEEFFKTINELVVKIIANRIEPELTLYWDGIRMTLGNVHDLYKLYSLDQLQINYDYFKFLVRWFLALMYTRIIQITKEIAMSNTRGLSPNTLSRLCFLDELENTFEEFQKLPLYISMPVNSLLVRFIYVIKSYDGINNDGLHRYITELQNELEKLDYIPPITPTTRSRTYSIYIQMLIETISDLIRTYETVKSTTENAITNIGVDLNDTYMMFHEWE